MKSVDEILAKTLAEREAIARCGLQRRGTVFLEDLPPGERFILGERRGTVLHVGSSGVMVRYDGRTEVEVNGAKFTRPITPQQLARRTEVMWEAA